MSRVLVFCGDRGIPAEGPSGASHHLRSVAHALDRRGHHVQLATPRRADHRGAHGRVELAWVGSEPRSWRILRGWRDRGETWDARRLAERATALGPIDLIWERHSLFVDAGMRLARRLGVPRVVELNAPLSLERPGIRDRRYARRVELASLRAADRVLAVSSWLADWAVHDVGVAPERVVHLPNGTDCRPGDREAGRQRLGITGPIAIWVGSCKAWHGLERLPALLDALPEWSVVVVGDGPTAAPSHPRSCAVGRVVGVELNDLLAAADVGLSLADPRAMPWVCPLKILDYRAAGLPVVTTDSGDAGALTAGHGVVVDSPAGLPDAVRRAKTLARVPAPRTWDAVVTEGLDGLRFG